MMATHKIVLSVAQLQLLCNVSRRGMDFSHRKLEFIMPGSFLFIFQFLLYDLMKTFAFLFRVQRGLVNKSSVRRIPHQTPLGWIDSFQQLFTQERNSKGAHFKIANLLKHVIKEDLTFMAHLLRTASKSEKLKESIDLAGQIEIPNGCRLSQRMILIPIIA